VADHRRVVNGSLWKLATGCLADLPERYGPWQTCAERFRRWQAVTTDRGYSYTTCRGLLRQRQIPHTSPERSAQQAARARRGARAVGLPGWMRCALASPTWSSRRCPAQPAPGHRHRYDKLAVSYHSWLVLAALLLWLPA
jgi:transposase